MDRRRNRIRAFSIVPSPMPAQRWVLYAKSSQFGGDYLRVMAPYKGPQGSGTIFRQKERTMPQPKLRIVIIGAGFGGLEAAKTLRREPAEITLIDRQNYH